MELIVGAVVLIPGILLLHSGLSKQVQFHPVELAKVIRGFDVLPQGTVKLVSRLLPMTEVTLGILVILVPSPATLLTTGALFLTFAGAVAVNLRRGRTELTCSCFGRSKRTISWWMVWRNLSLSVACVGGMFSQSATAVSPRLLSVAVIATAFLMTHVVVMTVRFLGGVFQKAPESTQAAAADSNPATVA